VRGKKIPKSNHQRMKNQECFRLDLGPMRDPHLVACRILAVRPEGANHQWRKIPPGELSIDPVADERLGWATGRAGASPRALFGNIGLIAAHS
jgi:hypothetical protein